MRIAVSAMLGVPGSNKLSRENPSGTNKYDLVDVTSDVVLAAALS